MTSQDIRAAVKALLTICLAGLLLALSAPATAEVQAARGQWQIAQSDGMTLDQAVRQVQRQYNGRVVGAETRRSGNREIHYVKVLTEDGKVKTVTVPGRRLNNDG